MEGGREHVPCLYTHHAGALRFGSGPARMLRARASRYHFYRRSASLPRVVFRVRCHVLQSDHENRAVLQHPVVLCDLSARIRELHERARLLVVLAQGRIHAPDTEKDREQPCERECRVDRARRWKVNDRVPRCPERRVEPRVAIRRADADQIAALVPCNLPGVVKVDPDCCPARHPLCVGEGACGAKVPSTAAVRPNVCLVVHLQVTARR